MISGNLAYKDDLEIVRPNGDFDNLKRITEKLNFQDAVEFRYREIWNNAGIGIAIVSASDFFLDINEDYAQILGRPRKQIIGHRWQEFTPEPDLSIDQALVDECLNGKRDAYVLPKRYKTKDGFAYVILRVHLVRGERNQPLYFFVTAQNIGDKEEILKQLRGLNGE